MTGSLFYMSSIEEIYNEISFSGQYWHHEPLMQVDNLYITGR